MRSSTRTADRMLSTAISGVLLLMPMFISWFWNVKLQIIIIPTFDRENTNLFRRVDQPYNS